jgi:phosphotransferase system IIB component
MGRPIKNTEKLKPQVSFRMTESEHTIFMKKVTESGLRSSDFIRNVVLKNKTTIQAVVGMSDDKRELVRYFRAASNNLNQLAKRCNQDNQKGTLSDASYKLLLKSLLMIETYLKQGI